MPANHGTGFAHTGEGHYLRGPMNPWWPRTRPAPLAVYLHGAQGSAASNVASLHEMRVIRALSRRSLVLASDWGGDTFANDTGIARVHEGITKARANLNVNPGPVLLVGMSMGAGIALAYTLAHPENVRAVAGMIPGLDFNDVAINNRGGLAGSLNTAYGGAYKDDVHGPTHSPVRFAANLPADLPVRLWTSTNDTYAIPASATTFVTARPQTARTSMGAVGHSTASINGYEQQIADWCLTHLTT